MLGTKRKLMATVAMLVVSVMMMTSASFAWFTISTNPEITGMDATAVVNENLEIALGTAAGTAAPSAYVSTDTTSTGQTGDNTTWGNLVNLSTIFSKADITLKPVASVSGAIREAVYGTDGRVSTIQALTGTVTGVKSDGDLTTEAGDMVSTTGSVTLYKDAAGDYVAFSVDYWVQSNVAGNLVLVGATDRSSEGTTGAGSYLLLGEDSTVNDAYLDNLVIAFTPYTVVDTSGVITSGTITGNTVTADIADITASGTGGVTDYAALSVENTTAGGDGIVTLTANTPVKVQMLVYLDGATMTNADAILDATELDVTFNIQFGLADSDGVTIALDSMDYIPT